MTSLAVPFVYIQIIKHSLIFLHKRIDKPIGWNSFPSIIVNLVYVKGQDNTMANALSRYPSHHTCSDTSAKMSTQHPHTGFNKDNIIILDCSNISTTPLTSIAALT